MERMTRLELATSTLARLRSTRWATSAYGAFGRNRTTDTGIFSPLLYRLSYKGKWRSGTGSNRRPLAWQASVLTSWTTGPYGGNNRTRTYDPLLVRQMLSQLSYAPVSARNTLYLSDLIIIPYFLLFVKVFFNYIILYSDFFILLLNM